MFSGRVLKRDSARFAVLLLFSCFWGFVLRVFVAMLFVYLPVLVFVNFFHLRNNPVVLRRFRLSQYSLLFVYHLPVFRPLFSDAVHRRKQREINVLWQLIFVRFWVTDMKPVTHIPKIGSENQSQNTSSDSLYVCHADEVTSPSGPLQLV